MIDLMLQTGRNQIDFQSAGQGSTSCTRQIYFRSARVDRLSMKHVFFV
jgi:hypothetical protein